MLVAAREHLAMDVSFCSRLTATEQVIRRVDGDGRSFGLTAGARIAPETTYCRRLVDGRLPNIVADARRDERAAGLDPRIGAYIGVAVRLGDGRLHGTLSCVSHAAAPWLGARDVAFMRVLARMLVHELERSGLQRAAERERSQVIALGALFAGLDARDSYSGRHSEAVVELAERVSRELGMPERVVEEVKQVALLHDIGKIGIPDAILTKQGPLDRAEWKVMHTHPVIGARIVSSIATLAHLAPAVRAEHERCDGKGYPDALTREQIPLASRITFACDAYHAMISARPYRCEPLAAAAAAAELFDNAGTQFDRDVVTALLRVMERAAA